MNINVTYLGQLQKISGKNSEILACEDNTNIASFIRDTVCKSNTIFSDYILDDNNNIIKVLMVFIANNQILDLNTYVLKDNDNLMLMLPISGG